MQMEQGEPESAMAKQPIWGRVLRIDAAGRSAEQMEPWPLPGQCPPQWPGCINGGPWQIACWEGRWLGTHGLAPLAISLDAEGEERIWLALHSSGLASLVVCRCQTGALADNPSAVLDRVMLAIGARDAARLGQLVFTARPLVFRRNAKTPESEKNCPCVCWITAKPGSTAS